MLRKLTNKAIIDFVREYGIASLILVVLFFTGVHILRVSIDKAIVVAKAECVMPGLVVGDTVVLHGDQYIVTKSELLSGLGNYWLEMQKPTR